VPDLQLRLTLYKRLSTLENEAEIQAIGAEMIDRFGPMPEEVEQLLKLMSIKALCLRAHVDRVDAGPKGVIIGFRGNLFANPQGLVRFLQKQAHDAKVRPDQRIFFMRDFETTEDRLEGTRLLLRTMVGISEKKAA
jgi:transcription-repair coupling factor (superfamily II helicase)